MKAVDMVNLALSRLRTSRLRTALTMLGVIIGVASVVALVAVGQGSTQNITNRLEGLGTNLLTVNPGSSQQGGTFGAAGSSESLTVSDAEALSALSVLAGVAPEISTSRLLVAGDENTTTTVLGTTADYPLVRNYEIWQGSALTDLSVEHELRIVVIGATTADDLGLGSTSIGTEIKIGGLPFTVAGILQEKGGTGFQDPDDQVLIPITTLQKHFSGSAAVRTIAVSAASAGDIESAQLAIVETLREQHGLALTDDDDFRILDQAQLLETVSAVSDTLTLMLAGIASISLIVGGIGIMNIMLVSVRERTREIGIRKAIGARRRDILAQFLVESVTISLVGGLMGVVLGVAVTYVISSFADWDFTLDVATIAIAVGFSVAIGVVFGVWPARQAARLDPVEALRYE
jgi:putative ABC transport system permease protein